MLGTFYGSFMALLRCFLVSLKGFEETRRVFPLLRFFLCNFFFWSQVFPQLRKVLPQSAVSCIRGWRLLRLFKPLP